MPFRRGRLATLALGASAALVLVAAIAVVRGEQQPPLAGQQPPAQQPPPAGQQQPQQQPPVFRGGVKLVRVDATVTGKGDHPVADLTTADFEIAEDGVPQKVEQIQFIRLDGKRPAGDETSLEIRSPEQAEAEAARDDVRVFAIFFDDYHVDKAPQITIPLRKGLSLFVDRLWPTDLVAVMDPLTPLSAVRFTRSKTQLTMIVNAFEGRQGEMFPIKSVMEEAQWMRGDVRRVRAEVTLSALAALTMKLGGLREGRKSIIFVSQGPPTYLGSRDGNLQDLMREIVQAANRGNVTIYALDPTGLTMEARLGDRGTLYQLAAETGGRTIINTNDFTAGLNRVYEDTSAYYVLGYTPTRAEDDGKFHKISVKVKRSGMRVLARQGYWAPSAKELTAAAESSARVLEPRVAGALDSLAQRNPGKRPVDVWVGLSKGQNGRTKTVVTWDQVEPAPPTPVAGVDVEVLTAAGGAPIPPQTLPATVAGKSERTAAVFELDPGAVSLRLTARAADRSVVDAWTQPLAVPDWGTAVLALSTPRFYRARSLQELRAIQASPDPVPTAVRQFSHSDRVLVSVECYASRPGGTPELSAHVLTREGRELTALPLPALENGYARFELPVGSLGQGTYILRVRAALGAEHAEQLTAIRVAR
jgi:VWFA-related protein